MFYSSINSVPYTKNRAIIVNVGTRFVTTLSLLSALRNTGLPVLLVDCKFHETDDLSYFIKLMATYDFDLLSLPLNEHGQTLDFIFKNIRAENILLIDSDLDLLNDKIVPVMLKQIDNPKVFAAGFRHGGFKIRGGIDYEEPRDGYYLERMWIPFVLLKVSVIREALQEGFSFSMKTIYNILPNRQKFSKKLMCSKKLHYLLPFLSKSSFSIFNRWKVSVHGERPLVLLYDTGSVLYYHLRYNKNLYLAAIDSETGLESEFVKHYNGITRRLLFEDPFNTGNINAEFESIRAKLLKEYCFDIESFNKSVSEARA